MKWMIGWFGMTVGGAIGWWLGDFHSFTAAFVLSTVGTGFGLYYSRKWAKEYLE